MTHSDSITGLLDLKASDLTFPLDNSVKEGGSKLTGPNKALMYQSKQTICPDCGTYFKPTLYFIETGTMISSVVKAAIFLDLRVKMSM